MVWLDEELLGVVAVVLSPEICAASPADTPCEPFEDPMTLGRIGRAMDEGGQAVVASSFRTLRTVRTFCIKLSWMLAFQEQEEPS